MTIADAIMYAVILGVGLPASFRSPVALILLAWWSAGMAVWWSIGTVPAEAAILLDLAAFAFVVRHAASTPDILVASLFFPSIHAHATLSADYDFWLSWGIGLTQFLIAGIGALMVGSWAENRRRRSQYQDEAALFVACLRERLSHGAR